MENFSIKPHGYWHIVLRETSFLAGLFCATRIEVWLWEQELQEDSAHRLVIQDRDVRQRIETAVMDRILDAVAGAKDRNAWLREMNDQIEGLTSPAGPLPWKDACDLDHPMTMDAMWTVHANYVAIIERSPHVTTEAVAYQDERNAEAMEPFLASKAYQAGINSILMDNAWNTIRYGVGIVYRGWKETLREERYVEYKQPHQSDNEAVPEEMQEEGQEYEEVPKARMVTDHSGLDLRAVDLKEFFLYPADAKDYQKCWGCGELVWMSADELLKGIEDYGFDREEVHNLLKRGPNNTQDNDAEQISTYVGVNGPTETEDANYPCFLWFGKLPLLMGDDGEFLLDDAYLGRDVMFFCCPEAHIMLRMSFSPYGRKRPYVPFYFIKRPDSFYGYCLPQILNALQAEANVTLRHTINVMNMEMAPGVKVKESTLNKFKSYLFGPGRVWKFQQDPSEIQFMDAPVRGPEGIQLAQYLSELAREIYSSQGFGRQPSKVQKAAQIQQTAQAAASKFGVPLAYYKAGMVELYEDIAILEAENMEDEGEDFLDDLGHSGHITPQQLRGKYTYRALGSAAMTDTDTRIQFITQVKQTATEYNMLTANPQVPPDVKRRQWAIARKVILELGEHNPEEYIGKEPEEQPQQLPPQLMQQLQGMGAQLNGANGNSRGLAIGAGQQGMGGNGTSLLGG